MGLDNASFVAGNLLTFLTHIVVNSDHCFLCLFAFNLKLLFVARAHRSGVG